LVLVSMLIISCITHR